VDCYRLFRTLSRAATGGLEPWDSAVPKLDRTYSPSFFSRFSGLYGDGSKPWYLVNPKIAGKWMFIPLKMILIGIDPYPYPNFWGLTDTGCWLCAANCWLAMRWGWFRAGKGGIGRASVPHQVMTRNNYSNTTIVRIKMMMMIIIIMSYWILTYHDKLQIQGTEHIHRWKTLDALIIIDLFAFLYEPKQTVGSFCHATASSSDVKDFLGNQGVQGWMVVVSGNQDGVPASTQLTRDSRASQFKCWKNIDKDTAEFGHFWKITTPAVN